MPGPLPKDPAVRQRTNRASSNAKLEATERLGRLPNLPRRADGERWHRLTVAFWRDVQRSPMAAEYLQADLHGLYVLAELVERFWRAETSTAKVSLAAEIRQQRQGFGLTPIDRRRLQWEVQRVEHAVKGNPPAPSRERVLGDPRAVLHAV
jgi:hypothetical protein